MKKYNVLLAVAFMFALTACDTFDTLQEGMKHSQAVAADLERATKIKPFVGFNWSNGSLTNVSVVFDHYPEKMAFPKIAALARKSVKNRFKQEAKNITISFTVSGISDKSD